VPSHEQHNAHVTDLEAQQYAAGKALNEEQALVSKREVELGRWRGEREEVRGEGVGEGVDEGFNARA
jgi:kinetochore protein Spc24